MNKLEKGMYVRTKNGCICQILRTTYSKYLSRNKELCYEVDRPINVNNELYDEDIMKASHNIIDLIEDGDYVNGEMVMEADWSDDNGEYEEGLAFPLYDGEDKNVIISWLPLKYTKIKTIVTKEQFEAMKYEVE